LTKQAQTRVKYSGEVWGAAVEISGLTLLLAASIWQAQVSDWFSKNDANAVTYSQSVVNKVELEALHRLADLAVETDPVQRGHLRDNIHTWAMWGLDTQSEYNKSRADVWQRQGNTASSIRSWLFILGALLVIGGKAMIGLHKAAKERATQVDTADKTSDAASH
jgi:hypothetical protein